MIIKYNDFLNETIKEELEKERVKDEKRYLSKKERDRLNSSQRRCLVSKRKELGSMNDADLKESLKDKMVGKSEDELEKILGELK